MGSGFFEVEIQRNLRAVDEIELIVESSHDLLSWSEDGIYVSETNLGSGIAIVKYRVAIDASPKKFVRARWVLRNP